MSPENSEDGALPPVADASANVSEEVRKFAASHPGPPGAPNALAPLQSHAATTTFPSLPATVGTDGQIYQQQGANAAANAAKRRRVDVPAPMLAMAGAPDASAISGQQLAAAAAQAMQQGHGRKKTQAQVDRRRERNRILARRTRLRKKFFFESLQKEVTDLQRENAMLKDLVKMNISGEDRKKILDECNAAEKLPPAVLEACGEHSTNMDTQDFSLVRSVQQSQHSFVITDPSLQDNPIVFASDAFLKLTGYTREQVLGRNCRFLQGTETSQEKIDQIRKALTNGEDVTVTMVNYTADGTPFWNKLFIAALRDAQNNIVNFIGVIVKVASPEPGEAEHGKSLPGQQKGMEAEGDSGKEAAESTVKAIEGAVDAAVAAASGSSL